MSEDYVWDMECGGRGNGPLQGELRSQEVLPAAALVKEHGALGLMKIQQD